MALLRLVVVSALVVGAGARAGADESRAKELLQWGQAAYDVGRYGEAAQAFNEAYAETKQPRLLGKIGSSYRKQFDIAHDLADLRRAQVSFHRYAELAPPGNERTEAEQADREVSEQIAQVEANERAAATKKNVVEAPPPGSRVPGAVIGALGLVLGAAGGVFSFLAADASSTVQNGGRNMPTQFGTVADTASRGSLYDTLSYVAYGLGAAAFVVGVVLFVARPARHAPSGSAWIVPSPGGALVRF